MEHLVDNLTLYSNQRESYAIVFKKLSWLQILQIESQSRLIRHGRQYPRPRSGHMTRLNTHSTYLFISLASSGRFQSVSPRLTLAFILPRPWVATLLVRVTAVTCLGCVLSQIINLESINGFVYLCFKQLLFLLIWFDSHQSEGMNFFYLVFRPLRYNHYISMLSSDYLVKMFGLEKKENYPYYRAFKLIVCFKLTS